MEKLIVKNFLTLQDIDLDIKKINIIIGRQSEGKSVLAKLVYFFKNFFDKYFVSIVEKQNKLEFDKNILDEFQQIFSRYTWQKQNFEIEYLSYDFSITLSNVTSEGDHTNFRLDYSENFFYHTKKLAKEWKKLIENEKKRHQNFIAKPIDFLPYLKKVNLSFYRLIYLPAGRSFFSVIEDNIFTFLNSNISIDYFLREFGASYQFFKNIYGKFSFDFQYLSKIQPISKQILSGQYLQEEGKDYILLEKINQKIRIAEASSGQQEFLPISIILTLIPFVEKTGNNLNMIFIEEPEAHLFPLSQKSIIDLIATVFNYSIKVNKQTSFFLTTHSPYILISFNNLIQAGNTLKAIEKNLDKQIRTKLKKQLFAIVDEDQILDINDFSVYMLQQGKLENIIDQETQLINASLIDEISDEIGCTFDQLLSLEIQE